MSDATRFQAIRTKLGLTQAELGALLGLTARQIRNLETGSTPVRRIHRLALHALLNAVEVVTSTRS